MRFTRNDIIELVLIKQCFDINRLARELGISRRTIIRLVPEFKTKDGGLNESIQQARIEYMRRTEFLSYREISRRTNIPLSTVYRNITNGLADTNP